nr:hypothetical protein [Acholeplasmatales bacterium]
MKKTILVTFIFSLLFLLVACGSSKKNSDSTKSVVSTSEVSKSESSQNTKATESSKSNSEAVSTSKTNVETSISEENVSSEVKTSDVETSNEEKTSNDEASSESTIEESSSLETRYNITFNYALYDKTNALINSTTENGVYGTFTENTTVEENGELALSATLVEGYTFSGWY